MGRKTVSVAYLLARVNYGNKRYTRKDVRQGMNVLLEIALHETGNYEGFRYLEASELPEGSVPGIVRADNGHTSFPDETRVEYYVNRELREAYREEIEKIEKRFG